MSGTTPSHTGRAGSVVEDVGDRLPHPHRITEGGGALAGLHPDGHVPGEPHGLDALVDQLDEVHQERLPTELRELGGDQLVGEGQLLGDQPEAAGGVLARAVGHLGDVQSGRQVLAKVVAQPCDALVRPRRGSSLGHPASPFPTPGSHTLRTPSFQYAL